MQQLLNNVNVCDLTPIQDPTDWAILRKIYGINSAACVSGNEKFRYRTVYYRRRISWPRRITAQRRRRQTTRWRQWLRSSYHSSYDCTTNDVRLTTRLRSVLLSRHPVVVRMSIRSIDCAPVGHVLPSIINWANEQHLPAVDARPPTLIDHRRSAWDIHQHRASTCYTNCGAF